MSFFAAISNLFFILRTLIWDVVLTLGNFILPSRPVGSVTPEGQPGHGGHWPAYKALQNGDSRSACPGLNAMANHGIFPRDGKGIKFTEASERIVATFNLSSTLSSSILHVAAGMLNKDYDKDTFDLEEMSLHNGIEHDASLTRQDTALQPDQAVPHPLFIDEVFSYATGKDTAGNPLFTLYDLSRVLWKRRAECKATNKQYTLSFNHKLISSANTSFLWTIFGGRVDDLQVILRKEEIPQGWESRVRNHNGLTVLPHNLVGVQVELGVLWPFGAKQAVAPAEQG